MFGLEIALARSRHPPGGEQRVADDEARAHSLGDVVADTAVVVGEPVELEVVDEPVEADRDACGPVEDLRRDLGGDRVGAGLREVEDLLDLVVLPFDRLGRRRFDPGDEVVDLQHLDVRPGLRLHLRQIGVHVEHPGVRVAEEADPRRSEVVDGARGVQPLAQSDPGGVAVGQRPRDGAVGDSRPGQRARYLGDAARGAVGEPLARRHALVVDRARRLEVEDDDGGIDRLDDREDLRGRRVGGRVDEQELRPRCREGRARHAGRLGRVDETGRDDLGAHLLEATLDPVLVAGEAIAQAVELRPVRRQPDAEHRDAQRSVPHHDPSSRAATAA